jgi:hypothetical protein
MTELGWEDGRESPQCRAIPPKDLTEHASDRRAQLTANLNLRLRQPAYMAGQRDRLGRTG